ncbi:uncharacterized protein JCM10292_000803 [Rhodotorula paludigena]|uniref:uncharacterized protein n=1 Tax=Rhodotorula paludigena TaxID=86838 RepID=UPI0031733864
MSASSRSPARSGSLEAHTVLPELVTAPSPLSTLASTLRTWAPFDLHPSPSPPAGQVSASPPAKAATHARTASVFGRAVGAAVHDSVASSSGRSASALMLDDDDDSEGSDAAVEGAYEAGRAGVHNVEMGERIAWAKWDSLPGADGQTRRVLILGYTSGGLAVWNCSSLDSWSEILNLGSLEDALDPKLRKQQLRHGLGTLVDAGIVPLDSHSTADSPLLAVLARPPPSASSSVSTVFLYSLRTHCIVSTVSVPGIAHRILVSCRFLVVSTTSPLALHVFQPALTPDTAESFLPAPCSPITDVAPSPFDGAPVFTLSLSGRLLAYATSSPVLTSQLSRALGRPGTGILAHHGQFSDDHADGSSFDALAGGLGDAPDVARRVGEGLVSGARALREAGLSYWSGEPASGSAPRAVPRAEVGARTAEEAAGGSAGTVKVVDLVPSGSATGGATSASKTHRSSMAKPQQSQHKVVAHFRPYQQSLALLSFSPSSTMLLASSSTAHSFDVFELKPAVPVGVSATSTSTTAAAGGAGKVWHRYRLHRGITSAHAASASWTSDGRFVAVSTSKGTAHVYAVEPTGGAPGLVHHFDAKVSNAHALAPLSIALGSVARVQHPPLVPSTDSPVAARPRIAPIAVSFLSKATSASSSAFRADPAAGSAPHRSAPTPLQDVLVFRPSLGSASLHRLMPVDASAPAPASPPLLDTKALAAAEVGRLASTAVSGLTQLMKSRGVVLPGGAAREAGGSGRVEERKGEWAVRASALAEFRVAREKGWREVKEVVARQEGPAVPKTAQDGETVRYSAFAEIETFSRSPLVLPRSIYQSQQFDFFALPADHARYAAKGSTALPLRRLETRSEVQVRQGTGSTSSDSTPSAVPHSSASKHFNSSSSFEPASFDQPIKTAMHALLDFDQVAPGSPKLPVAAWPNGVPGKHGSWRDSIPIPRNVGPAALEGIGRVRQGLGRVRMPAGMLPVAVGRRMSLASGSSATASGAGVDAARPTSAAYSSSISFDDDDAVFADRLDDLTSASISASTACTSEVDEDRSSVVGRKSSVARGGTADDEDWGWDDPDAADEASTRAPGSSGSALAPLSETTPFEEDFVAFEFELPTTTSTKATVLAVPSPLALEPVDDGSKPASSERHLAPPVSTFPTSLDDTSSPSSSPSSTSGFAAPHLLDGPGASLSGISILSPTANALAAPTNGMRSASPALSSASGGSSVGARRKKRR